MEYWLQVTSGRGPDECCWVVARIVEAICREVLAIGGNAEVLEFVPGNRSEIFKSALISIKGEGLTGLIDSWTGTVQWTGQSQYRPNHKRKNWFVGVELCQVPDELELNSKDLRFETMRSSGPGGQHVNKTESAIRVTHVPTGISTMASGSRCQHMNRKLALRNLNEKLEEHNYNMKAENQQSRWAGHGNLERGNPVRVFRGEKFKEVR